MLYAQEPKKAADFARLRAKLAADLERQETLWLEAHETPDSRGQDRWRSAPSSVTRRRRACSWCWPPPPRLLAYNSRGLRTFYDGILALPVSRVASAPLVWPSRCCCGSTTG